MRAAVLQAATVLADRGETQITVAALAGLSGVSEVTIYRRWGSADNVVLEAAVEDVNRRLPLEPTGDLRHDLIRWAHGLQGSIASPRGRRLLSAVMSATSRGDHPAVREYLALRREPLQALIDAAQSPVTVTVEEILDRIAAPLYLRQLLHYEVPRGPEELVDDLLAGPADGGARPPADRPGRRRTP